MELQLDQKYRKPVHQYWHYCSWDFPFRNRYPRNTAIILNIEPNIDAYKLFVATTHIMHCVKIVLKQTQIQSNRKIFS